MSLSPPRAWITSRCRVGLQGDQCSSDVSRGHIELPHELVKLDR